MARIDTTKSVAHEVIKMHKTIKQHYNEQKTQQKRVKVEEKREVNPDVYNGKWRRRNFGIKDDPFELAQYQIRKLDIL